MTASDARGGRGRRGRWEPSRARRCSARTSTAAAWRARPTRSSAIFASLDEVFARKPDVLLDLTTQPASFEISLAAVERGVPAVVGASGWSERTRRACGMAARRARLGAMIVPNFSLGAMLMMRFARASGARSFPTPKSSKCTTRRRRTSRREPRCETARANRERRRGSAPPIHSVRLPGCVAHQEVLFGGAGELLTIRHDSLIARVVRSRDDRRGARGHAACAVSRSGSTRSWTMDERMNVAVVGATGAVGETILRVLEERDLPVATLGPFASRARAAAVRFRGTSLDVRAASDEALARIRRRVFRRRRRRERRVRAGAARARPRRHRQQRDVSHARRRAADRSRGQPRRAARRAPALSGRQLHGDRAVHGAAPDSRRRRVALGARRDVSGRERRRPRRARRVARAANAPSRRRRRAARRRSSRDRWRATSCRRSARSTSPARAAKNARCATRRARCSVCRSSSSARRRCACRCGRRTARRCLSKRSARRRRGAWPRRSRARRGIVFHRDGIVTPRDVEGTDDVHVARLRAESTTATQFALWCVGDQLRKGAATNAVQILELLLAKGYVAA